MIVVDAGCATHGGDMSVERLVQRFHPSVLYGFDPQVIPCELNIDGTRVVLDDRAAWVSDTTLRFAGSGLGARVSELPEARLVKTIDVVEFLASLETGTVLKLDVEGSEWPIVKRLIETRVDATLSLVLVEWHCYSCGHGIWSHALTCDAMDTAEEEARALEQELACPVERWEF